jgi:hypothetical protein
MRIFSLLGLSLIVFGLSGCANFPTRSRPIEIFDDMDRHEKYKAQTLYRGKGLFADDRSNRMPVVGTVAVGHLKEDDAEYRGLVNGQYPSRLMQHYSRTVRPNSILIAPPATIAPDLARAW